MRLHVRSCRAQGVSWCEVAGCCVGNSAQSYTAVDPVPVRPLHRVGARRWISRIMISWGAISTAMIFVRTTPTFYVLRFLLGTAEAGFFPGVVYYLSHWYPEGQRARAIAAFMTAVPVSGVIGGPLSGALLSLNGLFGLAGWQWLFLAEGLPAILLGAIVLIYLIDRPEAADWLSSAEKGWLVSKLAAERTGHNRAVPIGIFAALTNRTIWRLGIIFFFAAIGFYGYSFWAPLVVNSLTGSSDVKVGIILGAISAVTIILMALNSAHSDRTDERPPARGCSVTCYGRRIFWVRSPVRTELGGLIARTDSDRALRGLWSVWVDANTFPRRRACCGRSCVSRDDCKRRRFSWSDAHWRVGRSCRRPPIGLHAAGNLCGYRGAARLEAPTG